MQTHKHLQLLHSKRIEGKRPTYRSSEEKLRKFPIFIYSNSTTKSKIADIRANQELSKFDIKYGQSLPSHVRIVNDSIINEILKVSQQGFVNLHKPEIHYIEYTDVHFMIIGMSKWRRCEAYYILQMSDIGTRLLAYYKDEIVHSGTSFGTNCDIAVKSMYEEAMKAYEEFKRRIPIFESIIRMFRDRPKFGLD